MLFHQIAELRILLVVGKSHTNHIGQAGDVRDEGAAAQLNVVGMRADAANRLSEEGHIMIHTDLLFGKDAAYDFGHD